MSTTLEPVTATDQQIEELAGRIFGAALGATELATVQLGQELGLYSALDDAGELSAAELAERTGLATRYVREWLQSQAISGFVIIDGDDVDSGRYRLAPGIRETLLDQVNPSYVGGLPPLPAIVGRIMSDLAGAFRTGDGVPYAAYGPEAVSLQEQMNRPAFENSLVTEWLPQLPDVLARLQDTSSPARVADVCCGTGWSAIVLAEAFPHLTTDGYDNDEDSIARARRNAAERGVADRVRFEVRDVSAEADLESTYDVAFMFEALHDLPHPVQALRNVHRWLQPGGTFIVMDENVAEDLTAPGDEVERFFAAVSVVWCTPQGHGPGSEVVGTVMRPRSVQELASRAGYASAEVAKIEHPFFRFYRLRPSGGRP